MHEIQEKNMGNAGVWGLVSGLNPGLLKKKDYEALMSGQGLSSALSYLESTVYGKYMKGLPQGATLIEIHRILDMSYKDSCDEVLDYIPQPDRDMAVLFIRGIWDLQNLLAILRANKNKCEKDILEQSLSPLGTFDPKTISGTIKSGGEFPVYALPKAYRRPMESAMDMGGLSEAERFLERSFWDYLLMSCGGEFRENVLQYLDILNLRTLIMCKLAGVEAKTHIISRGLLLSENMLERLAASDIHSLPQIISNTPYYGAVLRALKDGEESFPDALDLHLSGVFCDILSQKAIQFPVSPNSAIAYLKNKEREVNLLKAILSLMAYGMPKKVLMGVVS